MRLEDLTDEQIDEAAWRMAMQTVRQEVHQEAVAARCGTCESTDEETLAEAWEASQNESQAVS